ncbi:MAG: hypothetical protein M3Z35_08065 [Nitrospirota bacterium]|nr:hypothetical protein [Nitrospirota bacterium]
MARLRMFKKAAISPARPGDLSSPAIPAPAKTGAVPEGRAFPEQGRRERGE